MKKIIILIIVMGIHCFSFFSNAQTWNPTQRLTWDSINSKRPVIILGSGNDIHIAWYSMLTGHTEIYYKKSTDSGTTWMGSKRLTWSNRFFSNVDICTDVLNRVFVVFPDVLVGSSDVFFKKSEDGGVTWSTLRRVTWTAGHTSNVSVASDTPGNTYIVWNDKTPGNSEIFFKKSTSGGDSWLTPQRLTWTAGDSYFPTIFSSTATTLHVAWSDGTPTNPQIFYKSSIDGGISWSPPRRVTWSATSPKSPEIAVDSNGHIYIVWQDDTATDTEIFIKKSTDGGATWSALKRLTWNSGDSYGPDIEINSIDGVNIVWYDDSPGNGEIFYKKSTDGGFTWMATSRITWSAAGSNSPDLAIASTNQMHVTWEENLPGDSEIFYKKSQVFVIPREKNK